ncbi:unnamed protein product [Protopolystoma xenopodis]|uniref:Uncharacterized protein n=1 Tax=Protopolystoma xenopodis TaxID=117903 RepID=A0A3S5BI72_9PLAT|nr:unnamed protein product [Protopolystoma xenopodis]
MHTQVMYPVMSVDESEIIPRRENRLVILVGIHRVFGNPCNSGEMRVVARKKNRVWTVFDVSHSLVGRTDDKVVFSFHFQHCSLSAVLRLSAEVLRRIVQPVLRSRSRQLRLRRSRQAPLSTR